MQEELVAPGVNANEPFVKCYFDTPPCNYCFSKGGAGEGTGTWKWIWYGIALLVAQADGQMEPGVSSTKNNQAASEDSMRP